MIFHYLQNISLFTNKLDKVFHINIPDYIYTIFKMYLTLFFIMLKNGQTYFKNLAVFTPQDF